MITANQVNADKRHAQPIKILPKIEQFSQTYFSDGLGDRSHVKLFYRIVSYKKIGVAYCSFIRGHVTVVGRYCFRLYARYFMTQSGEIVQTSEVQRSTDKKYVWTPGGLWSAVLWGLLWYRCIRAAVVELTLVDAAAINDKWWAAVTAHVQSMKTPVWCRTAVMYSRHWAWCHARVVR